MRIVYWPSFHLKNHQQLAIGETKKFEASIIGLENEKIVYKSEDPDIISIDDEGNVTGLKKGRGDISASAIGKKARLTIDVYDFMREKIKNIAHMGLKSQAPENTIASFQLAVDAGFDYVEANLQVTKDKEFICLFSNSLKPMTGFDQFVEDLDYKDIKEKRFISGKNLNRYPDLYIPTLDECLSIVENTNTAPLIELKHNLFKEDLTLIDKINDIIKKHHLEDRAVVMSANKDVLNYFKKLNPNIQLAFKDDDVSFNDIDYLKENNLMVFLDFKIAEYSFIEDLDDNNIKVIISLINEKDNYNSIKYWPVYGICSSFKFFDENE